MDDDKLNRIEETLAHQDQSIHDLSEMVIRQDKVIEALHKKIEKLQGKLESTEHGTSDHTDKPPHY